MSQRHVAVSMDFSPSSKYALNWAMENVVKDKDHVVLILVNKKDGSSQGLWEEQGSREWWCGGLSFQEEVLLFPVRC